MFNFAEDTYTDDSVVISIGLQLPLAQEEEAIMISQEISAQTTCEYVLDHRQNPPRVRLYETAFPKSEAMNVKTMLSKLAAEMKPFLIGWDIDETTDKFVIIWAKQNEAIRLFHETVLETISPLRHGFFKQKYASARVVLTKEERASLAKWGSPWAEPYRPHMILSKAKTMYAGGPPEAQWDYHKCIISGLIMEVKKSKEIVLVERIPFDNT